MQLVGNFSNIYTPFKRIIWSKILYINYIMILYVRILGICGKTNLKKNYQVLTNFSFIIMIIKCTINVLV